LLLISIRFELASSKEHDTATAKTTGGVIAFASSASLLLLEYYLFAYRLLFGQSERLIVIDTDVVGGSIKHHTTLAPSLVPQSGKK
jgi:hypothetical protein